MSLIEIMSKELRLDLDYVRLIARSASHRYKRYTITTPKGSQRTIYHPAKELKALQYWLDHRILRQLPVHKAACAYKKGASIKKTAKVHLKNNFLLRMDFEKFFESLSSNDLKTKIPLGTKIEDLVIIHEDSEFMCNVLFRYGQMTIGAPSSPTLSNILMYDFDERVVSHCKRNKILYTRYVDDMFFSCAEADKLSSIEKYISNLTKRIPCPANLKINRKKTRHSSRKGKRYITGLILTCNNEISIGRAKKREIKALVHKYLQGNYKVDELHDKRVLQGLLAYVKDVEPQFLNNLMTKYGAAEIKTIIQ